MFSRLYRKSETKESDGKSDSGSPAAGAAATAPSNVAAFNMMAAAYNPTSSPSFPAVPMPSFPMNENGQIDPNMMANMNAYQQQMLQMQQQMAQMQAMLQAQQAVASASAPASTAPSTATVTPTTSQPLPSSSTMPALQQYHMSAHQVPQPPAKPEVAPMQMKALCNNLYSLVKAINNLVESTGVLKEEARKAYRLIKRVELLVSDLQPYAMQSASMLEAVFAVLQDVEAVLLCIKLVFEDCSMKGRLTQYLQADRALEEFQSLTHDLDEAIGQLPVNRLGLADEARHNLASLRSMLQACHYTLPEAHRATIDKYRGLCEGLKAPVDCVKACQREVMAAVLADGGHEDHAAMISDLMRELRTVSRDKVHGPQDEFCLRLMVDLLRIQNSKSEAPIEFVCPITFQVMVEPVLVVDTGYSYEKAAITDWFNKGNKFCPRSGTHLKRLNVVNNCNLRNAINQWRDRITAQLDIAPVLTTVLDANAPTELPASPSASDLETAGQANVDDVFANAAITGALSSSRSAPAAKVSSPGSSSTELAKAAALEPANSAPAASAVDPEAVKAQVQAQMAAEMQAQMAAQMATMQAALKAQMEVQMAAQQQAQKALMEELAELRVSSALPSANGSARASSAGAAPPAADTPAPTATQPQVTSPNNSTMLASGIVLQHDDEEEEVVLGEQAPAKIASAGSLRGSGDSLVARRLAEMESKA